MLDEEEEQERPCPVVGGCEGREPSAASAGWAPVVVGGVPTPSRAAWVGEVSRLHTDPRRLVPPAAATEEDSADDDKAGVEAVASRVANTPTMEPAEPRELLTPAVSTLRRICLRTWASNWGGGETTGGFVCLALPAHYSPQHNPPLVSGVVSDSSYLAQAVGGVGRVLELVSLHQLVNAHQGVH